jgi:hypothetical protein
MPKLEYHLKAVDHTMLWLNRTSRATQQQVGRQSEIMMPDFCTNDVWRRGWRLAVTHLEPMVELHRGTLSPNLDVADARDNRNAFLNFLKKPEIQMSRLFADSSTLGQKSDAYQAFRWLCKEGILNSYTPMGVCLIQPQIQYGPTELPRKRSRMQITIAYEGVAYVYNNWGKKACQGAHLFEIVKRVIDPRTGYYGPFAVTKFASMTKDVPMREYEYKGVSGNTEYGAVFYRGRVIDVLGAPPVDEDLDLLQGLRGTIDESLNALMHQSKLKILLASPAKMG